MSRVLEVVAAGLLSSVQDLGRPGLAHLGVPPSGALDRPALRDANRAVGNAEDAAALELTGGGLRVRAIGGPVTMAVTGAPLPISVDGRAAPWGRSFVAAEGETVAFGMPVVGLRSYVAVHGGIGVDPELGSRSTDLLSGTGPAVLTSGDRLRVVSAAGAPDVAALPEVGPRWTSRLETVLRVHPGPRVDWFATAAWRVLVGRPYTVSSASNRVAIRLDGESLTRSVEGELPSEGIVTGSVQVPSSGQPLVFLADHPTTGGYPVIAVVDPRDLAACAQLRPGAVVRFETAR